ncbi:MAG: hypothetical protein LQ339_006657 [Xanthoria mediterranea]|nr:MAG: hypothetical protein LQ339_006657 [Xanthoria mediterranea]
MEQIVLAAEAGCISVSPFTHELRAHLGTSYQDAEPILPLYAQACRYYRHHHIPTKIKACAFMTTQEILSVAPVVDAMTLPAEQLEELAAATAEGLDSGSRVVGDQKRVEEEDPPTRLSYVDDEGAFLRAYCLNARGRAKTEDSIAVFCGFQVQAEALVRMSELN